MAFENQGGMMDKVFNFEDLKVFVDAHVADVPEWLHGGLRGVARAAGFKFDNPQVKSTCGAVVVQRKKQGPS